MSYADAAASSGPLGAEKIPEPVQLEQTTEPLGKIETVDKEELDQIKEEALKAAQDAVDDANKHVKDFKKELEKLEKDSKSCLDKVVAFVKDKYAAVALSVSSKSSSCSSCSCSKSEKVACAKKELQNPVVLGQLAVIAGGATAGWFVYSERARIRTDSKCVVAVHAAVITALVLADVYVFGKLYPKYKK